MAENKEVWWNKKCAENKSVLRIKRWQRIKKIGRLKSVQIIKRFGRIKRCAGETANWWLPLGRNRLRLLSSPRPSTKNFTGNFLPELPKNLDKIFVRRQNSMFGKKGFYQLKTLHFDAKSFQPDILN